jgi:hypothetical protein
VHNTHPSISNNTPEIGLRYGVKVYIKLKKRAFHPLVEFQLGN